MQNDVTYKSEIDLLMKVILKIHSNLNVHVDNFVWYTLYKALLCNYSSIFITFYPICSIDFMLANSGLSILEKFSLENCCG